MRNARSRLLLAAAILASAVLGGCSVDSGTATLGVSDSQVLLGSSAALGGHASFLGTQYLQGTNAYIEDVNAAGGVHGRQIRIKAYDDGYEPERTEFNTATLIDEDAVFALVDYVGTPTSVSIIEVVHRAEIPAVGFLTGAEALRTPFRPNMFHIRDSYYAESEAAIAYFVDELGFDDIAVMYQKDAFGLTVLMGVELALERRGMIPGATANYERGTMNVEDALGRIAASGADAVVMVGTYGPLAKFIKLSHDQGFEPYFHTVSFVGSEAFSREITETQGVEPERFDRIIVTQVVPSPFADEFETVRHFRDRYAEHSPDEAPNFVALEGYINAMVIVEALERAGPDLTREAFVTALESLQDFDLGIGKTVSYASDDREGLEGIYYSRLSDSGRFETFEP